MGIFNNESAKLIIRELARKNNCEKEITKELEWLSRSCYLEPLFVYSEIIKELKKSFIAINISGSIGYLLTANLLGISDINPKDYNLPYCFFKAFKNVFTEFKISVDSSKYNQAKTILENTLNKMGCRCSFIGHQCFADVAYEVRLIWLSPSNTLKHISKCAEPTNINLNDIPFGDKKAIEYMLERDDQGYKNLDDAQLPKFIAKHDYMRQFTPDTYFEFARVYSLIFGNVRYRKDFFTETLCDVDVNIEEVYNRLTNTYDISSVDAIRLIYDLYHRERYTESDGLVLATHQVREDLLHNFNTMSGCLLKALQDVILYYKLAYIKTHS